MTPEQIDLLRALSAPLVDDPLPWSALSAEQQAAFRLLMPAPAFDATQRKYINLWWLPVTAQQLADLNALCPPNTAIAPREDIDGGLYVSVDLLSDALDDGRLLTLTPVLQSLPLTYKLQEDWPVPEEDSA